MSLYEALRAFIHHQDNSDRTPDGTARPSNPFVSLPFSARTCADSPLFHLICEPPTAFHDDSRNIREQLISTYRPFFCKHSEINDGLRADCNCSLSSCRGNNICNRPFNRLPRHISNIGLCDACVVFCNTYKHSADHSLLLCSP